MRSEIEVRPAQLRLIKKIGEVWTVLDTASISTVEGQWYTLRAEYVGADVRVWRSAAGELETEVLASGSAAPLTTSAVMLGITSGGATGNTYEFDNVRILADGLSTTTTFAVNDADELVSATDTNGGTTYYEYDAWGRMTRKYMGTSGSPTFEATYEYKYDDKLVAVTSNFPDEGSVTYEYGGDGERRSRTAGNATTYFNWGPDGSLLSEENGSGSLVRSFVGVEAELSGGNPALAEYMYAVGAVNDSVRCVLSEHLVVLSRSDYSPYGASTAVEGEASRFQYAGLLRDSESGLYHTPNRFFDPLTCRWLSREPTGIDGPNSYFYALLNPVTYSDANGLSTWSDFLSWFGGRRGMIDCIGHHLDTGVVLGYPKSGWILGGFYVPKLPHRKHLPDALKPLGKEILSNLVYELECASSSKHFR